MSNPVLSKDVEWCDIVSDSTNSRNLTDRPLFEGLNEGSLRLSVFGMNGKYLAWLMYSRYVDIHTT
jgi:hypothetical protein